MAFDEEVSVRRPLINQENLRSYHSVSASGERYLGRHMSLAALIRKLINIINVILPEPLVKPEYLCRPDKSPVSEELVKYVKKVAVEYDLEDAVVYCMLRTTTVFQNEAERDETKFEVCKQREIIAQFLAMELLQHFPDRIQLYVEVLTKRYTCPLGTTDDDPTSALEFALDHEMTDFIASPLVTQCVSALWRGSILLAEEKDDGTLTPANIEASFVVYKNWSNPKFWVHVDPVRLTVPKYQSLLELGLFLVFLAMYTYIVNNGRSPALRQEIVLYLFVFGYIFDDIRQLYKGGVFYIRQLWNWLNILFVTFFVVALCYRLRAAMASDPEDHRRLLDTSLDVMSTVAVVLWMRVLTMLDGFRFIGTMTVILESMLKEGVLFFFMAAWIFIGFVQTFYALDDNNSHSPSQIVELLLKAFFQQPDFDSAETYHPYIGKALLMVYIFMTLTILLNLLIALFNDSYSKISAAAHAEFLKRFTYKVFHYLRAEDHYPFTAPFNLLEVFVIIPLGVLMSPKASKRLNKTVLSILFSIPLFIIAAYETWKVRSNQFKDIGEELFLEEHAGHTGHEAENSLTQEEKKEIEMAMAMRTHGEVVSLLLEIREDQKRMKTEIEELKRMNSQR